MVKSDIFAILANQHLKTTAKQNFKKKYVVPKRVNTHIYECTDFHKFAYA